MQGAIGNDGFIQSQREIAVSGDNGKILGMRSDRYSGVLHSYISGLAMYDRTLRYFVFFFHLCVNKSKTVLDFERQ